jgi:hypothetical protein
MIPAREALSALLLLAFLSAAVLLVPERPGPGPLALCAGLAALHAALLSPLLGHGPAAWGLLPTLLALPALAATSYGRPGLRPLAGSVALVALAALSGAAARALGRAREGLYGATVVLLFAGPYALGYLARELGDPGTADGWLLVSPWAAAERVAEGASPPAPAVLALLAWPVWAIARRSAKNA